MATTFESSTDCWWSNEVFMPGHTKEQQQQQQRQPPFKDFVLISEFSELEGPLPLALVVDETYIDLKPYTDKSSQNTQGQFQKDLKRLGLESFDFNAFVLRAVSVDRSTEYEQIDQDLLTLSSTTPSPLFDVNEPPPCAFSIPDDTQVYFTDSDLNFFAFTHHLTLFDINARGYVHPVALSYITRDRDKVVIRFEELMDRFNEVSREMKKGNYSNFLLDLKCRLLDLEYTESILRNATATTTTATNTTTATATSSLAKIADSAKTISDTNNHNNINNNKNIDTTKNNNSNNNNNNNTNSNNNTKKVTSSSSSSSPLSLSLSSSPLSSSSSNPQQSQQQKPTLSIQALKQAITATRLMIDTLELNTGHTEERNKESKDSASDDNEHPYIIMKPPKDYKPKYVDTLYPVAHFERKLRSLEQLCLKPEEEEQEDDNKNTKKEEEMEEEAKRRHSMTTITQTVIPLVSIIEPQPANASTQTVSFVNAIAHDMYSEAIKLLKEMTRYLGKSSVELDVDEEELAFIEPLSSAVTIGRTFVLNMDNPKPRKKEQDKQSKEHLKQQQQLAEKKEKGSGGLGETNNSNMNMEDSTDDEERKEKDKEIEKKKYFPTNLITSQLWKIKSGDTPSILKTLRRYQSLMVNVIFSLLTGRTVLVKGSLENKKHIQEVVRVLSIFVPGHNQEQHKIIEWFEEKLLTDAEIGSIKLVGLSKEIIDSSIYKLDSSCVFDIDANGHLESSPVYIEGQWINQLLDRIMLFTSDESYLAYLHTVFMTMSLKAFVYHHLYVYDEFKEERTPHQQKHHQQVTTPSGYISETSSESSVLNRKWSVRRIMNYLKRIEERENKENGYNELPPSDIMSSTSESYLNDLMITDDDDEEEDDDDSDDDEDDEEDDIVNSSRRSSVRGGRRSEVDEDDDDDDDVDYADENQATVTLQSIKKDNSNKAGALATLFPGLQLHSGKTDNNTQPATATTNTTTNVTTNATTNNTPTTATTTTTAMSERGGRRGSLSSTTYSRDRIEESDIPGYFDYPPGGDYYFDDGSSDYSSSDEEERVSIRSQPREDHVRRVMDEVRPDGMTFVEQRGRQYLQDKLKVYGDDQTIVVYLATSAV